MQTMVPDDVPGPAFTTCPCGALVLQRAWQAYAKDPVTKAVTLARWRDLATPMSAASGEKHTCKERDSGLSR